MTAMKSSPIERSMFGWLRRFCVVVPVVNEVACGKVSLYQKVTPDDVPLRRLNASDLSLSMRWNHRAV